MSPNCIMIKKLVCSTSINSQMLLHNLTNSYCVPVTNKLCYQIDNGYITMNNCIERQRGRRTELTESHAANESYRISYTFQYQVRWRKRAQHPRQTASNTTVSLFSRHRPRERRRTRMLKRESGPRYVPRYHYNGHWTKTSTLRIWKERVLRYNGIWAFVS